MSGGAFEYSEFHISQIWESIESELKKSGKEKGKEDLMYLSDGFLQKYPEEQFHTEYSEEVKTIFKKAINVLQIAYIYAHRIDYYLSGDDGEEDFKLRLKKELLPFKNFKTMLEDAFDAGNSFGIGSHKDFEQMHPSKKEYIKTILKNENSFY